MDLGPDTKAEVTSAGELFPALAKRDRPELEGDEASINNEEEIPEQRPRQGRNPGWTRKRCGLR